MVKTSNLGLSVLTFLNLFLFHVFECFTCMYIYEHVCMDPAESVRFPFSVSVGAGNQTEILCKNRKCP